MLTRRRIRDVMPRMGRTELLRSDDLDVVDAVSVEGTISIHHRP